MSNLLPEFIWEGIDAEEYQIDGIGRALVFNKGTTSF